MGFGDRLAAGSGTLLLISVLFLPWFAISAHGEIAIGSEAGAFRWLDAIAAVLLACALISVALAMLRGAGLKRSSADDAAVVVAAAGLTTVSFVVYRIAVPPEAGGDFFLQAGLDPAVQVTPRVGAVFGLLAGIGMLAGGALSAVAPSDEPEPSEVTAEPGGRRRAKPVSKRTRQQPGAPPREPVVTRLRLADATEEELRGVGLSPTQARRVIRYRDELGLISGADDLDAVPGIPASLRAAVKRRLPR